MRAALLKRILFVFSQQIKLLIRQWVVGSDVAVANRLVIRAWTMIRLRYYGHISGVEKLRDGGCSISYIFQHFSPQRMDVLALK